MLSLQQLMCGDCFFVSVHSQGGRNIEKKIFILDDTVAGVMHYPFPVVFPGKCSSR